MRICVKCFLLCLVLSVKHISGYKEITGILDEATDLKPEELNALRPLFNELQSQHDYMLSVPMQSNGIPPQELETLYENTRLELELQWQSVWQDAPRFVYDTKLPTVAELMGNSNSSELTPELLDMQDILQESLDEAQHSVNELVQQALQLEADLIRINKPKILTYVYKALSRVFQVAARSSRAAYCTYTYIPDLSDSLQDLYSGADCYTYTAHLILRVQNETVQSVRSIKHHVQELAKAYKKIAAKRTIAGKLVAVLLNIIKITRNIHDAIAVGIAAADGLRHELPAAAAKSRECGSDFVATVPHMFATVSNLTACVLFVDETTPVYEFMLPEAERERLDSN